MKLLEQVLAGAVTEESDEMLFEEDIVLICTRIVERHEPQWLRSRLTDRGLPLAGRLLVVRDLRALFDEGLALLRAEDPSIAPELAFREHL